MASDGCVLLFPADFFHPRKQSKNAVGPFHSADVKVYVTARNNPSLCASCALQNDRVNRHRAKAERAVYLRQKDLAESPGLESPSNLTPSKGIQDTSSFSPTILERPGGPLRAGGCRSSGRWECRLYSDPVKRLVVEEKKRKPKALSLKDTIENSELIAECSFQPVFLTSHGPSGDERGTVFERLYVQGLAKIKAKAAAKPAAPPVSASAPAPAAQESTGDPEIFKRLYQDATRVQERKKSCNDRVVEEISRKFSVHPNVPVNKSALKSPGSASPVKRAIHFADSPHAASPNSTELGTYSTIVTEESSMKSP